MPDKPGKPSSSEEEYFAREDALKKQKLHLEEVKKLAEHRKAELKALHYMKCPNCGMDLHTIELRGLSIHRCLSCHGHWLNAGELEKLTDPQQGAVMGSVLNWFRHK